MMFIWLFSCWNPNENSFKCFIQLTTVQNYIPNSSLRNGEFLQNIFIVFIHTKQSTRHKQNTKWHEILCGYDVQLKSQNVWTSLGRWRKYFQIMQPCVCVYCALCNASKIVKWRHGAHVYCKIVVWIQNPKSCYHFKPYGWGSFESRIFQH